MKRKIMAVLLAAAMTGSLAGCGSTSGGDETAKGDKSSGKVYYLNFKPEQKCGGCFRRENESSNGNRLR